ncbi:hypothetical protein G205_15020 [Arthrobacter nitrophenolicus]|uniref:Uncharacterized protein n=1 Tax=Arthrobacter nitrophenolicus TaxID=683150 RepID=L8TMP8_9MICC|nr:hypothetical protein G205_15020 [Arthrobacter nitrophenolicus]
MSGPTNQAGQPGVASSAQPDPGPGWLPGPRWRTKSTSTSGPEGGPAQRPDRVTADEAAAGLILSQPVLVPAGLQDAVHARKSQWMARVGQQQLEAEVQGWARHTEVQQGRTG